ncbi:MAG: GIY-YIG nuclease family protein [Candidatus Omnitrophica bacterium]|nr:GIY-YIG nuclease family protein [Candidatus Omnitrophota bacterium]
MPAWVYVLESLKDGTRYLGSTGVGVSERLARHNDGDYRFTKGHRPWKMIYQEEHKTKSDVVKRERFLKSGKGREELKRILSDL